MCRDAPLVPGRERGAASKLAPPRPSAGARGYTNRLRLAAGLAGLALGCLAPAAAANGQTAAASGPAAGGQTPATTAAATCPPESFLQYGGLVYASAPLPASLGLRPGRPLGEGRLDLPASAAEPCRREQRDVQVLAVRGVGPSVAVLVAGQAAVGFILGGRCTGFAGAERWQCVRTPLRFRGVSYTGIRYPAGLPERTLHLDAALGTGTLGATQVEVRRIEGVEPSVAVAAAGAASEAFVAPGVCPYERFASSPATDDLARCLRGPLWFTFAPLGGQPGDTITATGDRPAPPELAGATVSLVRLRRATDALPRPLGTPTPIGVIGTTGSRPELRFAIPDLPQGLYESVVTCPRCAARFGSTRFPAGSILVVAKQSGSSGAKIVYILMFAVIVVLAAAGGVLWRRGYRFGRRRPPGG